MQESISVVSKLSTAEPELTTSLTKATPTATNFQTAQKSSSNSISISVLQGNIEPTTTAPPTNYNIFNSEIMIMSLLVIIAILLLALVVTLILMVVIVVVFKRRVRCAESRKTDTRGKIEFSVVEKKSVFDNIIIKYFLSFFHVVVIMQRSIICTYMYITHTHTHTLCLQ